MVKIALIVGGKDYSLYARILSGLEGAQCAGCFFDGELPADFPDEEGKGRLYRSADMLIEAASAVVVAGRPESRFEHLSHAIRKGKAVWSAYPSGLTLAETEKLSALAQEACVCNQVGHVYRRNPLLKEHAVLLQQICLLRSENHVSENLSPFDGNGVVDQILYPQVDRVLSLVSSPVKRVQGHWSPYAGSCEGMVSLEFLSGQYAEFWLEKARDSSSRMHCLCADHSVDFDFTAAKAYVYDRCSGKPLDRNTDVSPVGRKSGPLQQDLQDFVDCVAANRQGTMTFADSVKVQDIMCRIKKTIQRYG